MGGGAILRSFVKSPAAAAAAAAVTRQARGALGNNAASSSRTMLPSSQQHAPMLRMGTSIADDWEFEGDEYALRDHLVFGAAPSTAEVEQATVELETAFGMYVEGERGEVTTTPEASTVVANATTINQDNNDIVTSTETAVNAVVPPTVEQKSPRSLSQTSSVFDWIEPQLVADTSGNWQVRRRNDVMDAFRLLQNDPTVKGVVMSIASDKAVWDAVLSNEKVKELRRKLHESQGGEADRDAEDDGNGLVSQILEYSMSMFQRVQIALKDLMSSLLSFVDKKFLGDDKNTMGDENKKSTSTTDTALRSCFMLGVMVISVVLLKRAVVV